MSAHSESRSSGPKVVPVSALNRAVGQVLSRSFPMVWVSGELSNLTVAASGHAYFSLKDRHAQVRAVMFRSRLQASELAPRNGQQVLALASVSLYEPRGEFQLTVEQLRLAGEGDWHQRFARLKQQLQTEGLFDQSLKRAIPPMPSCIGVVTSLQAAALRDVLTTLTRRVPHLPVIVYPAPVQGVEAPVALVSALKQASRRGECDLLLLVRGGGSIEDLWAFNDEKLARAIRASQVPVIVGVGHESDVTIADFAADLRAPTPTAAAELAGIALADSRQRLRAAQQGMVQAWQRRLRAIEQRVDTAQRLLPTPHRQWLAQQQRVSQISRRLVAGMAAQSAARAAQLDLAAAGLRMPDTAMARLRVANAQRRLHQVGLARLHAADTRLSHLAAQLNLVSPRAVMTRGYAVVRGAAGQIHTSLSSINESDTLNILMEGGELDARVEQVRPESKATKPAGSSTDS